LRIYHNNVNYELDAQGFHGLIKDNARFPWFPLCFQRAFDGTLELHSKRGNSTGLKFENKSILQI